MSGRVEALEAALAEAASQYGAPTDEQRNRWLALLADDPPAGEVTGRPEEAEVRKQIDAFMESSGGLREYDRFVLSLCHSWLAQGRVIEAARQELTAAILVAQTPLDSMLGTESQLRAKGEAMLIAIYTARDALAACPADPKEQTP